MFQQAQIIQKMCGAQHRYRCTQLETLPGFNTGKCKCRLACTFSTSQRSKVVRTPSVLCILKCASRHNGAQFFIAPVASWLRTRRFSKPTFRPSGATNHWKNIVFRDFPPFCASASSFFLTLSLLLFSLLIFLFERRHHWSLESGFRN